MAWRLWRDWLSRYTPRVLLAFVLMAAFAAASTGYAVAVKWATDQIQAENFQAIRLLPLAVIGLTILRGGALYAQMVVTQTTTLLAVRDLQNATFASLLHADFARIQSETKGSLVARLTHDADKLREALVRASNNLVRDALVIILAVSWMFYLDWVITAVLFLAYPLAIVPVAAIGRRLRKHSRASQEQIGQATAMLSESFSGARMVKTYRLENYEAERARGVFQERFELQRRIAEGRARIEPLMEVAGGAALAGLLALAAWRVQSGATDIGDIVSLLTSLAIIAPAARALGTMNAVVQEGFGALERIFNVLDERPHIVDLPAASPLSVKKAEVQFEAVSFSYDGGDQALHQLDLQFQAGKTTALVGPSGAGKSTVLNLIPRLYDPTAGRVLIDGVDIRSASLASVRDACALVSQDAILFDDTIAANIAFGRSDATMAEIEAAAEAAAADFITQLADGFDTQVGEGGSRLSGGQRQRIALARAFLKDAPILLLDEATSALDAESEARVQAALDRLSHGRTTIVIAHRLATVMAADIIYVLDQGRVVERGTDAQLRSQTEGLYAKLRALQFSAQ